MDKTLTASPRAALKALQALADENRLRIVEALRDGERCVCELQSDLGLGQSLLSHHLRALRESGLVLDRKEGRWVHYSLSNGAVEELESYLRGLREDAAVAEPRGRGCSVS
jgi:ArsR family transcriptional regulator